MPAGSRTIKRMAGWTAVLLTIVCTAVLIPLVIIRAPGRMSSLGFRGFILLPHEHPLSVEDYLTVSGRRLFVTSETSGSVYGIALREDGLPDSSHVAEFRGEPSTHGVAIDTNRNVGYVTRSGANVVDVFDPNSMRLIERIAAADDPDAILYDGFDDLLYVANGDPRSATLIDARTHRVSGSIALGGRPEFAVLDAETRTIYQNLQDMNAVVEVDPRKRAVIQGWALEGCIGPSGMAIDENGHRLFIGCGGNARLVVFNMDEHRVRSVIDVGPGTDAVAFDPALHRIYATGKSGVLSVIQEDPGDVYRVLDTVHLHYGAHTLTVNPATHSVYVAFASLLVRPRVAVFVPLGPER